MLDMKMKELAFPIEGCHVKDLGTLARQEGSLTFNCVDGYIPDGTDDPPWNLTGYPAWESPGPSMNPFAARRLRMMHHAMHHMVPHHGGGNGSYSDRIMQLGYAVPVFSSKAEFHSGSAPVAWAVRAGAPVRKVPCSSYSEGLCGIFAAKLRDSWRNFEVGGRTHFGRSWGYNITKFNESAMELEVQKVISSGMLGTFSNSSSISAADAATWNETFPDQAIKQPFIIAEDPVTYGGTGWPMLYLALVLLILGFTDKSIMLCDLACCREKEGQTSGLRDLAVMRDDGQQSGTGQAPRYEPMPLLGAEAFEVDEQRGMMAEMAAMWHNFGSPPPQRQQQKSQTSPAVYETIMSNR